MSVQIQRLLEDLVAQMESGSDAYRGTMEELATTARHEGPESLTAAVQGLAPLLPGLAGDYAEAAVLAGACVEWGGSPMALVEVLPARAAEAMMLNAAVPELWSRATGGSPLPEPSSKHADRLIQGLTRRSRWWRKRDGARQEAMTRIAMSWFDMEYWLSALTTVMVDARFRAAVAEDAKGELRTYASAVAERSQEADWVRVLASVLDDEPLIVINVPDRMSYALTMSGVADMGQLHDLLIERIFPNAGEAVIPAFRLLDANGTPLSPDQLPADIEAVRGVRVLVLHFAKSNPSPSVARRFERMTPTVHLDRVLSPIETEEWLETLTPAALSDQEP
ncbi:hypothetical protein ACIQ6Y_05780 [Streptomyces sp. NPDC096205]|uniref:hypothetical protein n=1 Tax=Streptomyces sp. NPDC096205 TaxID=3366081 RepID=UPI003802BB40